MSRICRGRYRIPTGRRTSKVLSNPEVKTQEIISEHKQDEAGPAVGSTDWGGPVIPALWKLTISGNRSPTIPSQTRDRRGIDGCTLAGVVESRGEDARDNIGTQTVWSVSCSRVDIFEGTSRICSFGSSPSAATSPNNAIAHEKSTDVHWSEKNSAA